MLQSSKNTLSFKNKICRICSSQGFMFIILHIVFNFNLFGYIPFGDLLNSKHLNNKKTYKNNCNKFILH